MIKGVVFQDLKQIIDERGRVMHMLTVENPLFSDFGEIYFSEVLPGVIKAWKRHKKISQLLAVPVGMIKLVIYDDRHNSPSYGEWKAVEVGRYSYKLVRIPPSIWYGIRCISEYPALVANCTNLPHDPSEAENKNKYDSSIPYKW